MIEWTLQTRKLKDLKKHPSNPRKLTREQHDHLKKSMDTFGYIDKIIINTDGTIIGGHQRYEILKKQKSQSVECWVPHRLLEESEVKELLIRLNRNHGEFDYDILANEFDVPDLLDWGFNPEELNIGLDAEEIESEDESQVLEPAKDEDAYTKLGDIYDLNSHRICCGDSTNPDYVLPLLNNNVPILMVTDPPYGVEYDPNWRVKAGKGQKAAGMVQNDDKVNWALAWNLFPGNVAYVWHAGKFCSEVQISLEQAEFEIKNQIIWMKQNFAISRGDYHWKHEPCWYAVKKGCQHNWQGSRKECTVWEISNLNAFGGKKENGEERTAHSTQKPMECMAKPIRNNTAQSEGVYDPFLGSGTTLISTEQLGRVFYGLEISPAYCDIIIKRWAKWMQKNNREMIIKKNGIVIRIEDLDLKAI